MKVKNIIQYKTAKEVIKIIDKELKSIEKGWENINSHFSRASILKNCFKFSGCKYCKPPEAIIIS